jgi:hypothetical protein
MGSLGKFLRLHHYIVYNSTENAAHHLRSGSSFRRELDLLYQLQIPKEILALLDAVPCINIEIHVRWRRRLVRALIDYWLVVEPDLKEILGGSTQQ